MNLVLCSAFLMVVLFLPSNTFAQAIRFQPQGAAAAGQGNAFAAQADDASAIHFNPAGLTQVEWRPEYCWVDSHGRVDQIQEPGRC